MSGVSFSCRKECPGCHFHVRTIGNHLGKNSIGTIVRKNRCPVTAEKSTQMCIQISTARVTKILYNYVGIKQGYMVIILKHHQN